ncbi:hypothetical protein PUN28_000416 [Cardiocondyla obscurior]|uniref:Uncharacterized protein n=1 Tax=Cardiocondyla obscurior TaxID=286306 RepID=A0AAW2GZ88_9HYME
MYSGDGRVRSPILSRINTYITFDVLGALKHSLEKAARSKTRSWEKEVGGGKNEPEEMGERKRTGGKRSKKKKKKRIVNNSALQKENLSICLNINY